MKKITVIISVVILLVVAGAITWLFVSGKLVWADSNTRVATTKAVCDSKIVDKYNAAMYYTQRDGATEATMDEEGLKSLKTEILAKEGYKDDATCQAILFSYAFKENNYEAAQTASDAVHSLHEKGLFPDNNLRNSNPLFTYEEIIYPLSPQAAIDKSVLSE